jgi:hypothetical protein
VVRVLEAEQVKEQQVARFFGCGVEGCYRQLRRIRLSPKVGE